MVFNVFFNLILLYLPTLILSQGDWVQQQDIRTGRVVMMDSVNYTNYTATNGKISFNISYSSALDVGPTANAGLGITGLDTLVTNDLAVNLTIQNYTTTEMRISAEVFGDTICTHLAVNYIAVGYNASTFCQVIFQCYIMSTLNSGVNDRTETRTDTTILSALNLFVTTHLSGFWIHNSQGINNYLAVTADIPTGTSTINYEIKTAQNNTVDHICITTVVFCESCTQIIYLYWGVSSQNDISNATTMDPHSRIDPDARYQDQNRMFFGISALNLSRAFNRSFDMDTTEYADLSVNYVSNYGVYSLMMDYFWIARRDCDDNNNAKIFRVDTEQCENQNNCADNKFQTDQPWDFCAASCYYWCQDCSGSLPQNCTSCNSTKFRVLNASTNQCDCASGYVDIGVDYKEELCYACEYFIPGCDTCSSTTMCLTCLSGFVIDNDGQCACTSGYLVSGVCTNITGCTSAIENGGTVYCLACNQTLNYVRAATTYTCQCVTGYNMTTNQTCVGICGDGLQVSGQECDDGNNLDGDGCASDCVIESNYQCFNGSTTSPSICLISDGFSMTVKYVRRVLTGNIMQVGILIEPQYSNLTEINFKKYLTHDIPVSDYNATYVDGMLILDFEYTETIQSDIYSITMSLDPNVFYDTNISVTIPASGMNAKLTYDTANDSNFPLEVIVIILDVLALAVLLLSAGISERMIGIECVQVLQSVLFLQTAMPTTPSTLAPLQQLRYSSGYNQIFGTDYSRTYTFAFSLSSVGLQKQFFLSVNLMLCILLAVIIVAFIVKLVQKKMVKSVEDAIYEQDQEKYVEKYVKWTKVFNFIFERLAFIFGFLLMFLAIFAIMIQASDMSGDYWIVSKEFNLLIGAVTVGIVGGLVGLVCVTSVFPQTKLFPIWTKQWYPMVYFLYQSLFAIMIAFVYTQFYILYVMIALTVAFLIFNIAYRPYFQRKHNIALVFHQAVILTAEGVYLYEYLIREQNEAFYKIMVWVLTGLLYLVVAVSIYRIFHYRKLIEEYREQGYANFWDEEPDRPINNNDRYDNLKTPKAKRSYPEKKTNASRIKEKQPKETEMSEIKNRERKVSKLSKAKRNEDPQNLDWNYNQLSDEPKYRPDPNNVSRAPITHREDNQDTSRNYDLMRSDTKKMIPTQNGNSNPHNNYNNLSNNNNDPYRNESNLRNKYADEDDEDYEDEMYDKSPYDEYGFSKGKNDNIADDDPLALIKRTLRSDFASKLHGQATMRQA